MYTSLVGLLGMHLSRASSYSMYVALAVLLGGGLVALSRLGAQAPAPNVVAAAPTPRVFLDTYCITCHNQKLNTAGLVLDTLDLDQARRAMRKCWRR